MELFIYISKENKPRDYHLFSPEKIDIKAQNAISPPFHFHVFLSFALSLSLCLSLYPPRDKGNSCVISP